MKARVDRRAMTAWLALMRTHAAVLDGLEARLEEERSVPLSWHEVLVRLATAPEGKLRMRDLAHSVLLSKSGVTRLVDRMEGAGLVARNPCSSDGRVVYASITSKGREALEDSTAIYLEGFEEHFARHLESSDADALREALAKVLAAHGQASTPDCPQTYL